MCLATTFANAQLGKPTTNAKDTLYISNVYYNGTALNKTDWPDTIIVEDALNVYVDKYVYVKGKLKGTWGNENHYDASCNGNTIPMTIDQYHRYTIGDYEFVVRKYEPKRKSVGTLNLTGRTAISNPSIVDNGNLQGKVVVKICVNRNGDVIEAEAPIQGSTITNASLVHAAKETALKTKFNADENAPEKQVGSITYIFTL